MKLAAFFLLYFVLRVSSMPQQETCPNHWDDYKEVRCLKDGSGYALMTCTALSKATDKEVWSDTNIWVLAEGVTFCKKPFDKCRCYEHNYATWYMQDCECVRGSNVPNFPATGVIYWNGKTTHMDEYWSSDPATITIMTGEAHKNSNGQYLYKQWEQIEDEKERTMEFKIIVPNGKSFAMYSGTDKSKICRKESVDTEATLLSIWKRPDLYIMRDETEKKGKIYQQTWKYDNDGEDSKERYIWIVEYNSETGVGIPVSYTHYWRDEIEGDDTEITLDYRYHPVVEGDESFELHQYCSNI